MQNGVEEMADGAIQELIAWMKILLFTALVVLLARQFLFEPVEVHGTSMMPTFEEADKVLIVKISDIDNFDIIVFKAPGNRNFIKRVIGIPGDKVSMADDRLFLNGTPVEEAYLEENRALAQQQGSGKLTEDFGEFTVPGGAYFVLGDNRLNSVDSREIGFILDQAVVGEVMLRLEPFKNLGAIE
ncbi:MAG TPA: signal peptidase I [Planococcus sp. (in: firmicutes)]|nr:signal peptidase I [Planococcus sp. (in: firmicutes)]